MHIVLWKRKRSQVVRFWVLGGADIGRSSLLAEVIDRDGVHRFIMIDCGAGFSDNGSTPVPMRPAVRPDLIIVTHAHTDHSLLAPKYLADYNCPIWMTGPTFFTLVGPAIKSSELKKRAREPKFLFLDHLHVSNLKGVAPVFSFEEYHNFVISEKVELFYHADWVEPFPGVWIKFHPAGHIRGAAAVLLKTDTQKVMFSGDISMNDTPTVRGMVPPDFQPDILFLEATNGCANLPDRQEEVDRLINKAGAFRLALVPAFGVGRSPDLALDAVQHNFPTYLDGMGQRILTAYTRDELFWCDLDREIPRELLGRIRFVKGQRDREALTRDFSPKMVVTTGGMMTGPAMSYAEEWLEMSDAAVLDVGYVADGTPGRKLLKSVETGEPFEIYPGKAIKVAAHVERFSLSGHIAGPQNIGLVKTLRPGKVYFGHGDPRSRQSLAEAVKKEGFDAEALREGQVLENLAGAA